MRKILAIVLTLLIVLTIAVPVFACDGEIPERWRNWWGFFWWYDYTPDEPEATEAATLGVPDVSDARYFHNPMFGQPFLQIRWKDVENAESYDVEITKADGTVTEHHTDSNVLVLYCVCPAVYAEEVDTYFAATVRVRAVCGDVVSEWSEGRNIGCDALHVLHNAESHD